MAESITYPRVYELSSRAKAQWSAFYIAVIMGGLASGICWLYDLGIWAQATITGMGTFFAIGAALGLVSSLRGKLVLYQDYLDYHGIFALRRISRDDIKETCNAKKEFGVFCITIVLKSGQPKRVQICDFGRWDDVFEDFINAYPNVEIEARIAEEETLSTAVAQNPAFGSNEEERIDTYNRYDKRTAWLSLASIGIAGWGLFYPEPHNAGLYTIIAIPAVCLFAVAISQERLNLTEDNTSGRVSLYGIAFFSICALLLRAIYTSSTLIDWIIPAGLAVAAAFALTGLIAVVERRLNWGVAWATLLMSGLYAWSAGIVLNDILDDAKPRIERVKVLGKDTTGSDPDYELRLAAWGTFGEKNYEVSRKLYDKAQVGQEVCIRIYPGWLGWENYYVRSCDTGKPA